MGLARTDLDDELRGWLQEAQMSSGCKLGCRTEPAAGHTPAPATEATVDLLPTPQDGQQGARSGQHEEAEMRRVQMFDVNETLLDLSALDPHFERIFGDAGVRVTWFDQMIQSALVATVTGVYSQFGAHAMAALAMTAEQAGVTLAHDDKEAVAAHAWDVAGAARAGCATAFVARPGKVLNPLAERPAIVGADLGEVGDAILAAEQEEGYR
jgi:hypothetical protein